MTELEALLLEHAKRYVALLPISAIKAIDALRVHERKVSRAMGTDEWYCDAWPGREHYVVFIADTGDKHGMVTRWAADTKANKVHTFV